MDALKLSQITFCIHKDEPLKCRQLVLESSTGKFKNQTKQYGFLKKSITFVSNVTTVHLMDALKLSQITFCIHKDEPLKCRQLVLESSTGKFKNQTKQYGFLKKSITLIIFRGWGGGESDLQTSTSPWIHN